MVRAVLIWSEGGSPKLAELREAEQNRVGRSEDQDIRIHDQTISRKHAVLRVEDRVFVLENVSATNVAKVNDVTIERPVPLSDGDQIGLGAIQISFHDLQAGDRISGPLCSHCSRENMPADKDCWYCGTSLVNAPTAILEPRKALCRVLAEDGRSFDVHRGESFVVAADGGGEVVRDEDVPSNPVIGIRPEGGKPGVVLFAASDSATLNGKPPSGGQTLSTGDRVGTGAGGFTIIVR